MVPSSTRLAHSTLEIGLANLGTRLCQDGGVPAIQPNSPSPGDLRGDEGQDSILRLITGSQGGRHLDMEQVFLAVCGCDGKAETGISSSDDSPPPHSHES